MNIFQDQPEFIETDPRCVRFPLPDDPFDQSYTVTADIQLLRNEAFLPADELQGVSVLDIGCSVAASGAWALSNGARRYVGVDISRELTALSESNLTKYYGDADWQIVNASVEDFLTSNTEKFDVVLVAGVIYAVMDVFGFLRRLTDISDRIVIEAMQPRYPTDLLLDRKNKKFQKDELVDLQRYLEMDYPFTFYRTMGMTYNTEGRDVEILGFHHSLGAITLLMSKLNYARDLEMYHHLCRSLAEVYGRRTRYAVRFDRQGPSNSPIFKDVVDLDDKKYREWHR